jgi:hypothetical protein
MELATAATGFHGTRLTEASFRVSTPTRATTSLAASADPTDARSVAAENNQCDKMPLKLFLAGVQALDATMRARLGQGDTSRHG